MVQWAEWLMDIDSRLLLCDFTSVSLLVYISAIMCKEHVALQCVLLVWVHCLLTILQLALLYTNEATPTYFNSMCSSEFKLDALRLSDVLLSSNAL